MKTTTAKNYGASLKRLREAQERQQHTDECSFAAELMRAFPAEYPTRTAALREARRVLCARPLL